ncbi:MAG: SDR family NAD(P)-dependent oxidoreductase, partial [Desulfobacteraceae bacterium]|nr:SDR family NAD(P)-dependent oxidoreductase [Desulfobacteraceae bacterium]
MDQNTRNILRRIRDHAVSSEEALRLLKGLRRRTRQAPTISGSAEAGSADTERLGGIAVIGMACLFPDADTPMQFWQNLVTGKDSVGEPPATRRILEKEETVSRLDVGPSPNPKGLQAGFLPHIDRFDPLFFNISFKEAEAMDPQQRLFLQEAWHAMEDAGYGPGHLDGKPCGVFVGYNSVDYEEILRQGAIPADAHAFIGNLAPVLAARISYVLNLKGPNIAINTACSSSLVAVHLACESIRSGESEMALAGGVQLMTTDRSHRYTDSTGMLSPSGRCRTFDHRADGFVPGEGVGVVLLKAEEAAIADKDHIYGIIRGSGVNQDGRTNGITAPSAPSQTDLERRVYAKAHIPPDTIGYVEAHGTGTELGDPIEIQALTEAFRATTRRRQFCALGSVKSNIGHTLAASGIAGFIKAVLCLHFKKLVPSLHFEKPNPHIRFEESPFYVNTRLRDWPAPDQAPRRAAVSSFGMSGTNAHLVIEEYADDRMAGRQPSGHARQTAKPQLIVLSAKNEERLKAYAVSWLKYVEIENRKSTIENIAYTLQTGREAMEARLALVVTDRKELKDKLARFVQGESSVEGLFLGSIPDPKHASENAGDGMDRWEKALLTRDLHEMARLWVAGAPVDWRALYSDPVAKPHRIPLPTYPFAPESYWARGTVNNGGDRRIREPLHPLLDSNESTLEAECFLKTFRGTDFYLRDHRIRGRAVLPAAVTMEMARAAGERARPRTGVTGLSNVVWIAPIHVEDGDRKTLITLYPGNGRVAFEIHTLAHNDHRLLHAQGELTYAGQGDTADSEHPVDIQAIRTRCTEPVDVDAFYRSLETAGIEFGRSFRNLTEIIRNPKEALARIEISPETAEAGTGFVLHPSVLDAAVQAVTGLIYPAVGKTVRVPFALGSMEIRGALPRICYAHAMHAGGPADAKMPGYHVDLADAQGRLLARIRDLSVRVLESSDPAPETETLYFQPHWQETPAPAAIPPVESVAQPAVLLFDRDDSRRSECRDRIHAGIILVTPGDAPESTDDHTFTLNPGDPEGYRSLVNRLSLKKRLPERILHFWSRGPFDGRESEMDRQLETGMLSVLHLSRALLALKPVPTVRLVFVYPDSPDFGHPLHAAFGAFAETVRREHPHLIFKAVGLSQTGGSVDAALAESAFFDGSSVRYRNGRRQVLRFANLDLPNTTAPSSRLPEQGACLITGGGGGIGMVLADFLAKNVKGNLILTGRSAPTAALLGKIDRIKARGVAVSYIPADITKPREVDELLVRIRSGFKALTGVIHCAGVVEDDFLLKKQPEAVRRVLAPKILGTVLLDEMTREDPLSFFVLFSSLSAVTGSIGQSDYAFANSFMDHYAAYREQLRRDRRRHGKTLSVNWPLWRDGGMRISEQELARLAEETGMAPLDAEQGTAAFAAALGADSRQVVVAHGDPRRIPETFRQTETLEQTAETDAKPLGKPTADRKAAADFIRKLLSRETGIPEDKIGTDVPLEKYGLDSVMVINLNRKLEKDFGSLSKTLFFEYQTVAELAGFFADRFAARISAGTSASEAPRSLPARFSPGSGHRPHATAD